MYVAGVKVSNVLRFHDETNVDLGFGRPGGNYAGWTVLAGRNGSGKTSLLRCLALVVCGPEVGPRIAPAYASWRHKDDEAGRIDVEFHAGEFKGGLGVDVHWPAGSHELGVRLPSRSARRLGGPTSQWTSLPGPGRGEGAQWSYAVSDFIYAAGYGPFRRLSQGSPEPELQSTDRGRDPGQIIERTNRFATLFRSDVALSAAIPWLVGLHLRDLEGENGPGELLRTVMDLLLDGLLPDGYRVERVDSRGLWVSHDGRTYALQEMSDGQRTVAALVLDIVRGLHDFYGQLSVRREGDALSIDLPGIVLVDEIDAHLHVSWQKRIGGWLKRHFPMIQFIVTTHSPYICQAADPGGLIRLPAPGEHAGPRQVSEDLYRRVVYGSGDDAVLSELFGLESPYSERAEELRRELIGLEAKLFRGEASTHEEQRYQALSEALASSPSARIDEVSARLGRPE